jgi:predicted deacetylase
MKVIQLALGQRMIPDQTEEIEISKRVLREGLTIFESVFGYKSKSFIAPNFIYHTDLEQTLYENGVRYIQGMKYQKLPLMGRSKREMIRHYQGEKNQLGQYLSGEKLCVRTFPIPG